ncbi:MULTISPECIES: hypothetical protein [unclassified Sinorhizobium]|uniref:Thoeris anti-defense Tad2 family protein n=1 Tax=unclassified Sinorhizobium TaxID=2613772 RepID=UPI00352654D2
MNYGQAIEAMKAGGFVCRQAEPSRIMRLAHRGTTLQYFEAITGSDRQPHLPNTDDQLAEDWGIVGMSVIGLSGWYE